MPNRNGTGPMGQGSKTGRGLGQCNVESANINRAGFGRGQGRLRACQNGRGFARSYNLDKPRNLSLNEEKQLLEKRLDMINQQLDNN